MPSLNWVMKPASEWLPSDMIKKINKKKPMHPYSSTWSSSSSISLSTWSRLMIFSSWSLSGFINSPDSILDLRPSISFNFFLKFFSLLTGSVDMGWLVFLSFGAESSSWVLLNCSHNSPSLLCVCFFLSFLLGVLLCRFRQTHHVLTLGRLYFCAVVPAQTHG